MIEDYDPSDDCACCAEGHIDELFSASEAHSLKDYLDRQYGDCGTTSIEKVALPIQANSMGVGAIPVGGGDDFLMLDRNSHYSLPFSVQGYFSLVGCELADGSGETFRHYLLRFGNGEFRFETQEEARQREQQQDDDRCTF